MHRVGLVLPGHPQQQFIGLGARHGLHVDQAGRHVQLGADRAYTGPDCPPDMLELGGIPQGDYAPVPWLNCSARLGGVGRDRRPRRALRPRRRGRALDARARPARCACTSSRTPPPFARLRAFLRLTGLPPVLPEWAYGHWKSRDFYDHQRDAEADFDGYREHGLPLDAIVLDSPWETQYNTWEFNPHQFPDAEGMIARWRADGVRTVVWIAPWVNLESRDGQYPPDDEPRPRCTPTPAPNYEPEMFVTRRRRAVRRALVDGHGLAGRLHQPGRRGVVARAGQARAAARRRRDQGRRRRGLVPARRRALRRRDDRRAGAPGATGCATAARCSARSTRSTRATGVLFGRPGWTGQQAVGMTWGGDQPSDFWSLRTLVAATLTAAASGFSNWSHDVGGYLGERLVARARRSCCCAGCSSAASRR